MKRFLFWMLLLTAGLSTSAQGFEHYRNQFWQQMKETCRPGLRWEKAVTEVDEDGGEKTETKIFEVDCIGGWIHSGEEKIPLQSEEFGHLFEYAFDNPYYAPHLNVERNDRGISAMVKAGEENKTKLRLQRFETNPANGRLVSATATIVKDSPLYDLEVHIQVWFDDAGRYVRHEIDTKTDVLLGGSLHTKIKARLLS
jgi:hypothetical protein